MMDERRESIDPGWGWDRNVSFAQAVHVGDLLFLAGQMPVNPEGERLQLVGAGDIRVQVRQAFANVKSVLEAAGATMEDLVEITSYHTNLVETLGEVDAAMREIIRGEIGIKRAAWTAVGVASLALPGQMVKIKGVAQARG